MKLLTTITATLCLSLGLAACTTNPYTGQSRVSNAAIGAGIGAVAGAVIGNSRPGNHGRNQAIGAAIGALAGGGIGYYMDRQQAALSRELRNTGVSVTRVGNTIILNMPGDITFPLNQYAIQPSFYPVLNSE